MDLQFVKPWLWLTMLMIAASIGLRWSLKNSARQELGFAPMWLALLLTAPPFFLTRLWMVHVASVVIVLLWARQREMVGLVYVAAILLVRDLATQTSISGVELFSYTVYDSVALACFGALLFVPGEKHRRPGRYDAPVAIFLAILLLCSVRDASATHWLRVFTQVAVTLAIPYYIATRSFGSPGAFARLRLWLTFCGTILALIALFEATRGWPLYAALDYKFDVFKGGALVKFRNGWLRTGGPFPDSTVFGFVLVTCTLAAWAAKSAFRSRWHHAAVLFLMSAGVIATQSRGAWIGLGIGLVAAGLVAFKMARVQKWALPALGGVAMMYLVTVSNQGSDASGTADYRVRLWERGIEEFWKHPLFGDNIDAVRARMPDLVQGEKIVDFVNSYLFYALSGGIALLSAFLAVFVVPQIQLWARSRNKAITVDDRRNIAFVFAALASYSVMFAFTSFIERMGLLALIMSGLAGSFAVARRALSANSRSGGKPARVRSTPSEDLTGLPALRREA